MDIIKFKEDADNAFKICNKIKNNIPEKESDKLFHWVLNTEINANDIFVDKADAGSCSSILGLELIYILIHHAIEDDGELSFVSVDGEPQIIRAISQDFDNNDSFLEHVEKTYGISTKSKPHFEILDVTVDEFIFLAEKYRIEKIKKSFLEAVLTEDEVDKYVQQYKDSYPHIFQDEWAEQLTIWK